MTAHTFSTNLHNSRKRFFRTLFIAGGLFLALTQSYNFLYSHDEIFLLGLFVGLWILLQGTFFDYYMQQAELTIGDHFIRHHRYKSMVKPEQVVTFYGRDVKNILLDNYTIRLTLKDGKTMKLLLPSYTKPQFFGVKKQLVKFTKDNEIDFQSRSWWKKMQDF